MTAVVFIESAPARERAIRAVLADSSTPSSLRSARAVAPRVADALGVPVRPLGASLEQALAAFSNRASYQIVAGRLSVTSRAPATTGPRERCS